MPSGWDVYYLIFLSALMALGIPSALAAIAWFISSPGTGRPRAVVRPATTDPIAPGRRINARFFLATNAALILIGLILAFIPSAVTLQPNIPSPIVTRGLISIISIASFAALGLLYSARKGDLSWLSSHQRASTSPLPTGPTGETEAGSARE